MPLRALRGAADQAGRNGATSAMDTRTATFRREGAKKESSPRRRAACQRCWLQPDAVVMNATALSFSEAITALALTKGEDAHQCWS